MYAWIVDHRNEWCDLGEVMNGLLEIDIFTSFGSGFCDRHGTAA